MATANRSNGIHWVWLLIIVVVLAGLGVLAFAFLAPPTQTAQPTDQPAAVEPAPNGITGNEMPDAIDIAPYFQSTPMNEGEQILPDVAGDMSMFNGYGQGQATSASTVEQMMPVVTGDVSAYDGYGY